MRKSILGDFRKIWAQLKNVHAGNFKGGGSCFASTTTTESHKVNPSIMCKTLYTEPFRLVIAVLKIKRKNGYQK
jgi:hypothetical protein